MTAIDHCHTGARGPQRRWRTAAAQRADHRVPEHQGQGPREVREAQRATLVFIDRRIKGPHELITGRLSISTKGEDHGNA